jgi:transposase
MDKGSLEVLLARGFSLEEIGRRFDRHPSTIAYWIDKYGLEAVNRAKHVAKGAIPVTTLEPLVEAGLTISEIAVKVGRSKTTVRHWLGRHGLKTKNARGRRPAEAMAQAKAAGLVSAPMVCIHHGETEFVLEGRGRYRCKQCRVDAVSRHRRKVKETLVAEAGGCCVVCGYDQCMAALAFHHLDPREKRLSVSRDGVTLAVATARAEAQKCVLVCANCHAEIESGAIRLPDTVVPAAIRLNKKSEVDQSTYPG